MDQPESPNKNMAYGAEYCSSCSSHLLVLPSWACVVVIVAPILTQGYHPLGMAFALAPRFSHPRTLSRLCISLCSRPRVSLVAKQNFLEMPTSTPPPLLDKPSFTEHWTLFALKIPSQLCNDTRKVLKPHILVLPRLRNVLRQTEEECAKGVAPLTILLLKYFARKASSRYSNPPRGNTEEGTVGKSKAEMARMLRTTDVTTKVSAEAVSFVERIAETDLELRNVQIDYSHWGIDAILKSLLPDGVVVPTSFETIGHIVHLNLREQHENWKWIIGQVFFEKLGNRIRTVVNKVESTGGPFRTFKMEILAGDKQLVTKVKENGCTFELDFEKVYWNSRLEAEHNCIVQALEKGDILADAFCGVGPFAIPALKQKRCSKVFANDLNPDSVQYLKRNAKLNHVDGGKFVPSCGCARRFLTKLVREQQTPITKVIMNFPAGAPEFLDVFKGLYRGIGDLPMPTVYCYCFVKGLEDMDSAKQRVKRVLLGEETKNNKCLPDANIEVRDVRDVAPRKRQVCVSFQVPTEVAYGWQAGEHERLPVPKRRKVLAHTEITAKNKAG